MYNHYLRKLGELFTVWEHRSVDAAGAAASAAAAVAVRSTAALRDVAAVALETGGVEAEM